jgi:hypothetical protein
VHVGLHTRGFKFPSLQFALRALGVEAFGNNRRGQGSVTRPSQSIPILFVILLEHNKAHLNIFVQVRTERQEVFHIDPIPGITPALVIGGGLCGLLPTATRPY